MKKLYIIITACLLMTSIVGRAQSCTEMLRLGHELMQQSKLSDASGKLFGTGFSLTPASQGVVLAKSGVADVRLASRVRNSQQVDTVRMELRTNAGASALEREIQRLGYQFVEDHGKFKSYQNGAVKIAVFNPYNYGRYKVAIVFARDKNAPAATTTTAGVETITVNGVSFKMVRVEGGTFMMGATAEQRADINIILKFSMPAHSVTLSTFSIGETEVTQELWQAVMGDNPSSFNGPKRPVENVSWEDCQDFIRRLNSLTGRNFRLPTEAEWEYAARGGKKSNGYKYAGGNLIDDVAWYGDNSGGQTHDVAMKRANELGLYDMSGNVGEWCQDWYGPYSSNSQTNPTGASSGSYRILRGGSYEKIEAENYSVYFCFCYVSCRLFCSQTLRGGGGGLRLAF